MVVATCIPNKVCLQLLGGILVEMVGCIAGKGGGVWGTGHLIIDQCSSELDI